jgi:predicted dehydrogenase
LKVVLAGCGGISGVWLEAAKGIPAVEMVGLVDIRESAARQRKEQFGLVNAATGTDLRAMLKTVRPDVVFDCSVPAAHLSVTLEALRAACHVLGEKPLADSMSNARRMVAAARKAQKIYAVTQNRRYDPRIRALRRFLDSGCIGRLTTVNSDFYLAPHFGGFRDRMKHVLLLDMAIHTFDAARFISGADPVSVYAREWNPHGSWYAHGASAIAIFEMTDGIVYSYRGSWCANGPPTSWEASWRVVGEKGGVLWDGGDGFHARVEKGRSGFVREANDVPVSVPDSPKSGGHAGIIREFVECVRKGRTPETVCTDNIRSLAMVFAAIESAETGRRVRIRA